MMTMSYLTKCHIYYWWRSDLPFKTTNNDWPHAIKPECERKFALMCVRQLQLSRTLSQLHVSAPKGQFKVSDMTGKFCEAPEIAKPLQAGEIFKTTIWFFFSPVSFLEITAQRTHYRTLAEGQYGMRQGSKRRERRWRAEIGVIGVMLKCEVDV